MEPLQLPFWLLFAFSLFKLIDSPPDSVWRRSPYNITLPLADYKLVWVLYAYVNHGVCIPSKGVVPSAHSGVYGTHTETKTPDNLVNKTAQ